MTTETRYDTAAASDLIGSKQDPEALRKSEERFRALFESGPIAVYSCDVSGVIQEFNRRAVELWGREPKLGDTDERFCGSFRMIRPDGSVMAHAQCPMADVLSGLAPEARDAEVLIERPDGSRISVVVNIRPLTDPRGQVTGAINCFYDITARKEAEAKLRESEAEARRLLDLNQTTMANMGEGMYTVDAHGLVTSMNPEAERLFGWKAEELLGRRMHDATHYKHADGSPFPIEECAGFQVLHEGKLLKDFEDTFIRKDGAFFPVSYSSSPLRDLEGKVVGLVVVFQDITQRKLAEAELREADRRKSEFLAMLAHELRNPLAPIRNVAHVLSQLGNDNTEIRSLTEILDRQVGHMAKLVDDLLDVSRISRGKIDIHKERIELASVVHHAIEAVRPACDSLGHELIVNLPLEPIYLDADPTRMAQIVGNLLNNACKFTPKGGRMQITAERDGANAVISVSDNGIGIAEDQLVQIFDMFAQVDTSLERSQSGLGIGLTLVKNLVEMHGGTVEARSPGLGHGSEFIIRMPIATGPTLTASSKTPITGTTTQRRVLVVDDNCDAARSLAMLLKLSGHDAQVAHDGLAAVDAAAKLQFDVILLDIGLPNLNGYEAARRIRQEQREPVLLVALTGWGQDEDRRRSKEAGFDAHLVKPVDLVHLTPLLCELNAGP